MTKVEIREFFPTSGEPSSFKPSINPVDMKTKKTVKSIFDNLQKLFTFIQPLLIALRQFGESLSKLARKSQKCATKLPTESAPSKEPEPIDTPLPKLHFHPLNDVRIDRVRGASGRRPPNRKPRSNVE